MKLKLCLLPLAALGLTMSPVFAEVKDAPASELVAEETVTVAVVTVKGGG